MVPGSQLYRYEFWLTSRAVKEYNKNRNQQRIWRAQDLTEEYVISIAQTAIYTVLLVSAPMLSLALIVGLTIGIFQAVTSINEMTLTFIPKIVVVIVAVVVFAPWIIQVMKLFTEELIMSIPQISH